MLSAGAMRWDDAAHDFDWSVTDCLPRTLQGAFSEEPLYVDLRFVRDEHLTDMRNPRLLTALARVVAPVRGLELDELIAEDLRLHRRALWLARGGVAALVALTAAASVSAVLAVRARDEAVQARREAERQAVALSADGTWFAGAYETRGFFVRNLRSGDERSTLAGHAGTVTGLAFDRDASGLASAGMDQRVARWRISDLSRPTWVRKGHVSTAHTVVQWNPVTQQLTSSGSDSVVLLWPSNEVDEPLPLIGHLRPAYALAFSPDGRHLLAGDGNKQVMWWEIDPELWRQRACRLVNRNLSQDEWRHHVGKGEPGATCSSASNRALGLAK